jgi:hypothetical protein
VATRGVRYGSDTTLAAMQLCLGYKLRHLEPSFSNTDRLKDQEGLIGDFNDATDAIAVIIHAEDVVTIFS